MDFAGREYRLPRAGDFVEYAKRAVAESRSEEYRDRGLFLYLHVLEPHSPYVQPEEFRNLWLDPTYDGPFASGETRPLVDCNREEDDEKRLEIDERDRQAAIDLYDGNLRWADHNLGALVEVLREAGLYDEALLIVTSDHGEAFWQHGRWGHNDHLYDEMLRVPLVIKLPAGRGGRGRILDELVSIMDLVPSLCEWLDLPLPELPLDGRSLAALAEGQADGGEQRADGAPERSLRLRSHHRIPHVGVRTPDSKTILHRHKKTGDTMRVEHFELNGDPAEEHDVWMEHRGTAGPVVRQLERWIHDSTINRSRRQIPLTQMERKMLDDLGYAEAAD